MTNNKKIEHSIVVVVVVPHVAIIDIFSTVQPRHYKPKDVAESLSLAVPEDLGFQDLVKTEGDMLPLVHRARFIRFPWIRRCDVQGRGQERSRCSRDLDILDPAGMSSTA